MKANKFLKELGEELGKEAYSQTANYGINQFDEMKKGGEVPLKKLDRSNCVLREKACNTVMKGMPINHKLMQQNNLLNNIKSTGQQEVIEGEKPDFNQMWVGEPLNKNNNVFNQSNQMKFQAGAKMPMQQDEIAKEAEVDPVIALLIMALLAGIIYTVVGPPAG